MTVAVLALLCGFAVANAQVKGKNGAGVNFVYGVGGHSFNNVGLGLKYNYCLTDNFRLEASGTYYFKSGKADIDHIQSHTNKKGEYLSGRDTNWGEVNINAHYVFELSEKFGMFPVFGFTTLIGKTKIDTLERFGDLVSGIQGTNGFGDNGKSSYKDNHFRFGCNIGVGAQYNCTDDFAVTLEAKYKLLKDFGQFNLALGCIVMF